MSRPTDQEKIVLAVVGHCNPLFLQHIKNTIETIPHFKVIYLKTSSGKIYIVGEGENNDY